MKKLFHTGLHFDPKIVTITIVSTLALTVAHYHTDWRPYDGVALFLVIPMAFILFVFRENPKEYGFQLGDWKAGLALTLGALAVILPVLWFVVKGNPSMQDYYRPLLKPSLPLYTFLDLVGWEFLFRGWILFGYARKFGPDALWLQAVPFAIAHFGKPEIETLSTLFGGLAFGWVAWRTKSFLYPFLIHWAIFTFVVLVAGGFFG
jgi:membrane protease YdiL (CAAX protease family)